VTTVLVEQSSAEQTATLVREELVEAVRDRFDREYRRLRETARPALVKQLEADGDAAVLRDVTILDYHLAAIRDFLAPAIATCALVEQDGSPQWFVLAALPFADRRVIAPDSALGRALLTAQPGQAVEYPTPAGVDSVRVLAVEDAVPAGSEADREGPTALPNEG
jgi:hypothetical protein